MAGLRLVHLMRTTSAVLSPPPPLSVAAAVSRPGGHPRPSRPSPAPPRPEHNTPAGSVCSAIIISRDKLGRQLRAALAWRGAPWHGVAWRGVAWLRGLASGGRGRFLSRLFRNEFCTCRQGSLLQQKERFCSILERLSAEIPLKRKLIWLFSRKFHIFQTLRQASSTWAENP